MGVQGCYFAHVIHAAKLHSAGFLIHTWNMAWEILCLRAAALGKKWEGNLALLLKSSLSAC